LLLERLAAAEEGETEKKEKKETSGATSVYQLKGGVHAYLKYKQVA
jgi:hypothetical protein